MDFFERQARVRRQSRLLVLYFIVAVLVVVAAVDGVLLLAFGARGTDPVGLLVVGTLVTAGVILAVSAFRSASLRSGGGGAVAREVGGTRVSPDTTEPRLRRLQNVVEEISIASGVPVPDIYVLEGESGINAFAAGHSPADAAIAVTSGALERLNRSELEGVIAHEFSHVSNGDMRLNIRLIGVLFGIQALAIFGRVILRGGFYSGGYRYRGRSGRSGGGAGQIMLLGGAAMLIGYVGVVMGRFIKAAVSRQREYLADASAVEFTRQTEGLVGALKKIGGLPDGSQLRHGKVDDVSHMLFGNGLQLSSSFATHPPLVKRIQALDPSVDIAQLQALAERWSSTPPSGAAEDEALGLVSTGEQQLPAPDAAIPVEPRTVAASAAGPTDASYRQAEALLGAIPPELRDRAHSPTTALPLVLGLLLAQDPATRSHQHRVIADNLGHAVADSAWQEGSRLADLPPALRLPLSEIAFPALRHGDPGELQAIIRTVHALVWADGELSVHEYCLARVLYRDLDEGLTHREPSSSPRHKLAGSRAEVSTLLAVLATAGDPDPAAAQQAYASGIAALGLPADGYRPPAEGVLALDGVWPALDRLSWHEKSRLVESLLVVASHDGVVTLSQMELIRLVCSMLHCPLPPHFPNLSP